MQGQTKVVGVGIIIGIVIVGLFIWGKLNDPYREQNSQWAAYGVNCLNNGHTNANLHIHSNLEINLDGVKQDNPANIGINKKCMSELHTHDGTGKIHIESVETGKIFTLQQFFDVWGEKLDKEEYVLEMTVDGAVSTELGSLILKNNQKIVLNYSKR